MSFGVPSMSSHHFSSGLPRLRRVVVTGLGTVSPLGLSVKETWESAIAGRSGIGPITQFDTKDCPVTFAGEVRGFEPTAAVGPFRPGAGLEVTQICHPKEVKKMARFIHLSLAATMEAYGDSGLDGARSSSTQSPAQSIDPERIGINIGVGLGGLQGIEDTHSTYLEKGFRRISPFFIPSVIANMASGQASILLNLQGPNTCNVTACASSAHSIGEAMRAIAVGDADVMLAGGSESVICPLAVGGFASMRALSTRNETPTKASRPYDKDRDGFVIAEAAATLVLEEYEVAKKRGAKIYAELLGYGLGADAFHMTLPAPEGVGGFRAMRMSLKMAGLNPEQISYINAHGTSTPAGDAEEARAIAKLFPEAKRHLHISSTKSMTGHTLGAAGALEALFSILAVRDGTIPPTINLDTLDPECERLGLNFTPNQAVKKPVQYALSNSFGFGGTNASLIFGRI